MAELLAAAEMDQAAPQRATSTLSALHSLHALWSSLLLGPSRRRLEMKSSPKGLSSCFVSQSLSSFASTA